MSPDNTGNGCQFAFAPLSHAVTSFPVTVSFTLTPDEHERTTLYVGLMSSKDGFMNTDQEPYHARYPRTSIWLEISRSSVVYGNSSLWLHKSDEGIDTILAYKYLNNFQFEFGTVYTFTFTIQKDFSVTVEVSDGINKESVSSGPTSINFPLDQFAIGDIQSGIAGWDSPVRGDFYIRIDNVVVAQPETIKKAVGPATFWIGLKSSDDQGTQFDLRTEVYVNGQLVSEGETLCITGVTRNPSYAKEVTVQFNPVSDGAFYSGDALSLRVLTRIGTTPDGQKCSGPGGSHNNAVGLRLYYDAPTRPSRFGAEIAPDTFEEFYLHSTSGTYFLVEIDPTRTVKYKDSISINYNNGNPWKEIGTWSMTVP